MVLAALPRSGLHLALLEANKPPLDHVLYRDDRLADDIERIWPGKGIALGREGRLPLSIGGAFRQFRANRSYYRGVRDRIATLEIDRLILFLENEPLEASIADWFTGDLELWEEGLSHYVDLTGALWYATRGLIQTASGFYPRGAMARRADRQRFVVRDRFENGGLTLPPPDRAPPADRICFIGSPLVEDRLISRSRLLSGLRVLAAVAPLPIMYLPHPREDVAELNAMLQDVSGVTLAPQPFGLAAHVTVHGYRAFLAPVSTALLDLGAFGDSLFVPRIFGQKRMHNALAKWKHNPVGLAQDAGAVARFLSR